MSEITSMFVFIYLADMLQARRSERHFVKDTRRPHECVKIERKTCLKSRYLRGVLFGVGGFKTAAGLRRWSLRSLNKLHKTDWVMKFVFLRCLFSPEKGVCVCE